MSRAKARAYERLEDYLAYVLEMANEIKYNSEPYSQERRAMMLVTVDIENALDMVSKSKDREIRKVEGC